MKFGVVKAEVESNSMTVYQPFEWNYFILDYKSNLIFRINRPDISC